MSLDDWVPRKPVICAQINIGRSEIEALGGVIHSPEAEDQKTEICILKLRSGLIVALVQVHGNSVPGYTLMSMVEQSARGVLGDFMNESGLDVKLITWIPEDS
ncbi:hypothetical protein [Kitasatospora cineracea]|uniref:hypothetical protein n=1 Tax=Kitasatospora cineracea TaxID=88074 RepID=UPI00369E5F84